MLNRFSSVQLFVTLWTTGFSIHGIPQARILEWIVISFSRGSSQPRDRNYMSMSPALAVGSFITSTTWELLAPKNWCFCTVVLEKTLESALDCQEIEPVNPKGNQPWIFIGRTDTEVETLILWPLDAKSQIIGKKKKRVLVSPLMALIRVYYNF